MPTASDSPHLKAPPWHGWVVYDLLFSALSAGTFIVASLGDLLEPEVYAPLARIAYPIAFIVILADLVCLIFDLGDPLRFHHMLRTFKLSSPMSVGTWTISIYAVLCFITSALVLLPLAPWLHLATAAAGIVPALGVASYKGVLFSTTAQPGWKDARWLGSCIAVSSLVLGCAVLALVAVAARSPMAQSALRASLIALGALNLALVAVVAWEMRRRLAERFMSADIAAYGVSAGGGLVLPVIGLSVSDDPATLAICAVLAVVGAIAFRYQLVAIPHPRH